MNARIRRLISDYEKIKEEFTGHKFVEVQPEGTISPPEKYVVTYRVKGLKLDFRGKKPVETNKHIAEIYLHNEYPRSKPQCNMRTEIFHPNFRSKGAICIGDHWAAGETLVDIIIQIGNMIQYITYNEKSPLNCEAALWVQENKRFLPVSNIDLYMPEPEIKLSEEEEDLDIKLEDARQEEVDEDLEIELE